MFCQRVMVGVIILYDHVHHQGAFSRKNQSIDVSRAETQYGALHLAKVHQLYLFYSPITPMCTRACPCIIAAIFVAVGRRGNEVSRKKRIVSLWLSSQTASY